MSGTGRAAPEQEWARYLDALDGAVTAVALAVADEQEPAFPVELCPPSLPVPEALRDRAARSAAALAAVGDVLVGARDRVAHELSLVARHTASRQVPRTGALGTFLDRSA